MQPEGLAFKHVETIFAGPLPPPSILAAYEHVQAGIAERIVAMAESESFHRRSMEARRAGTAGSYAHRGQWMAFSISIASLTVAAWLAWKAGAWAAAPFALGSSLYPLVAAFLRERRPAA